MRFITATLSSLSSLLDATGPHCYRSDVPVFVDVIIAAMEIDPYGCCGTSCTGATTTTTTTTTTTSSSTTPVGYGGESGGGGPTTYPTTTSSTSTSSPYSSTGSTTTTATTTGSTYSYGGSAYSPSSSPGTCTYSLSSVYKSTCEAMASKASCGLKASHGITICKWTAGSSITTGTTTGSTAYSGSSTYTTGHWNTGTTTGSTAYGGESGGGGPTTYSTTTSSTTTSGTTTGSTPYSGGSSYSPYSSTGSTTTTATTTGSTYSYGGSAYSPSSSTGTCTYSTSSLYRSTCEAMATSSLCAAASAYCKWTGSSTTGTTTGYSGSSTYTTGTTTGSTPYSGSSYYSYSSTGSTTTTATTTGSTYSPSAPTGTGTTTGTASTGYTDASRACSKMSGFAVPPGTEQTCKAVKEGCTWNAGMTVAGFTAPGTCSPTAATTDTGGGAGTSVCALDGMGGEVTCNADPTCAWAEMICVPKSAAKEIRTALDKTRGIGIGVTVMKCMAATNQTTCDELGGDCAYVECQPISYFTSYFTCTRYCTCFLYDTVLLM